MPSQTPLYSCVLIVVAFKQGALEQRVFINSRGNMIAVFPSRALVKDMLKVVEVVDQDTLFLHLDRRLCLSDALSFIFDSFIVLLCPSNENLSKRERSYSVYFTCHTVRVSAHRQAF